MGETEAIPAGEVSQDDLYQHVADTFGPALDRLARAYEADPEKRRDLLQEIHLQLWRSLGHFERRCSLRTWVYRVAHHAATSHVVRERRVYATLVALEDLDFTQDQGESVADQRKALERLSSLIQRLKPLDRQIIVSYLEGMDAASIADITGLSTGNVAMKIHRIKNALASWFRRGGSHGE